MSLGQTESRHVVGHSSWALFHLHTPLFQQHKATECPHIWPFAKFNTKRNAKRTSMRKSIEERLIGERRSERREIH